MWLSLSPEVLIKQASHHQRGWISVHESWTQFSGLPRPILYVVQWERHTRVSSIHSIYALSVGASFSSHSSKLQVSFDVAQICISGAGLSCDVETSLSHCLLGTCLRSNRHLTLSMGYATFVFSSPNLWKGGKGKGGRVEKLFLLSS